MNTTENNTYSLLLATEAFVPHKLPDVGERTGERAYSNALGVRAGNEFPTADSLAKTLDYVFEHYPDFNKILAIQQLEALNAVSPELIQDTLKLVENKGEEI